VLGQTTDRTKGLNVIQDLNEQHWLHPVSGHPAGGITQSAGLLISWQNGPLGRGGDRKEPNGSFVETVINAAIGRLNFYQRSGFACEENASAISYLTQAREVLQDRTRRREQAGTEGTHQGN